MGMPSNPTWAQVGCDPYLMWHEMFPNAVLLSILSTFRGPVYNFAIHPTGKMALSISKDRTMKTWNLMTGRCAYTTNVKIGKISYDIKIILNFTYIENELSGA